MAAPFVSVLFLGSSLTFMMVYVWGRLNQHVRMSFLGLFPFTAPYLPWVLLLFSVLLGHSPAVDVIGIVVGHLYYFFEFVFPEVARIRRWRVKRVLAAPSFLHRLCGTYTDHNQPQVLNDFAEAQAQQNEDAPNNGFNVADGGQNGHLHQE
eukprot:CAMPEP_0113938646 /NCGR_PEP_ID=MMETSP1339-20121228/5070_1 /TAXON_ID=94617 /ORGANISM="Fibrocapsa japonica" /LENGTH=150 /DNA_ID=CAMNT_0000941863 /DNA_START=378 /DNA_END=830 /DNA_ORIENTATION=+ /assembly_acc=CAM_ASM_000762